MTEEDATEIFIRAMDKTMNTLLIGTVIFACGVILGTVGTLVFIYY